MSGGSPLQVGDMRVFATGLAVEVRTSRSAIEGVGVDSGREFYENVRGDLWLAWGGSILLIGLGAWDWLVPDPAAVNTPTAGIAVGGCGLAVTTLLIWWWRPRPNPSHGSPT